jgi:hypothetical protein
MALASLLSFAFQAFIVLIGWWVVHTLTIRRDSAKARKEIIAKGLDELNSILKSFHDVASSYHQKNTEDIQIELKIKVLLDELGVAIAMLSKLEPRIKTADKHLAAVRIAATRFNFEVIASERDSGNRIILDKLAQQVLKMKQFFLAEKYRLYSV